VIVGAAHQLEGIQDEDTCVTFSINNSMPRERIFSSDDISKSIRFISIRFGRAHRRILLQRLPRHDRLRKRDGKLARAPQHTARILCACNSVHLGSLRIPRDFAEARRAVGQSKTHAQSCSWTSNSENNSNRRRGSYRTDINIGFGKFAFSNHCTRTNPLHSRIISCQPLRRQGLIVHVTPPPYHSYRRRPQLTPL
jgi:hypothetical protein